jgi:hypothetical protein
MTPDLIIAAIKKAAPFATRLALDKVQRNETVIKLLKESGFEPTQPPKDTDSIYAYTLVEYGVYKPEPILKFFGEKEIKLHFWEAFSSQDIASFRQKAKDFIARKGWGDEFRQSDIKLDSEVREFVKVYVKVINRTRNPQEILTSKVPPIPDYSPIPDEFEALINQKIETFCGRKFVFEEIKQFISDNPNGYFTVVGDAGMGKSTIAAKYIKDNEFPCYFNIRSEGRNRPELFLKSIRQQLINRYWLQKAEEADLPTLLQKASDELSAGERLVIVVDALDEVEQEPGGNLLYLPNTLPNGVYFLLTRRPYNRENKRFSLSPDVPVNELDLRKQQYVNLNREDVKDYIWSFIHNSKHQATLNKWIEDRKIAPKEFVEQVADKSENNFMYLRYVLPEIALGCYNDLTLKELPNGLQDYYHVHWVRMGMEDKPQENKVIILFILVEIRRPIPCEMIAEIAKQDESEVEKVLKEWVEYLKTPEIKGITCYTIYHASFLDFLKGKRELGSTRKLFQDVNQSLVDFFRKIKQRKEQNARIV